MSSSELTNWIAYYQLEPFGAWRDNWHMATLATMYAQAHSAKGQTTSLSDFMFKDTETLTRERQESVRKSMLSLVKAHKND